jgi:hypothetical protein
VRRRRQPGLSPQQPPEYVVLAQRLGEVSLLDVHQGQPPVGALAQRVGGDGGDPGVQRGVEAAVVTVSVT